MKSTLIDHMGSDLTVANAARVSFGKHKEVFDHHDHKLIHYLAEHRHMSPFGHCFLSFHVKAPIFVARQLVKHKFLRWNEISRRYVDDQPQLYWPTSWRARSVDKKQGSDGDLADYDDGDSRWVISDAVDCYNNAILKGVAPEQARMYLPQNTYTEWYWSGSLDAFIDMYNLRSKSDSQAETQTIAFQVGEQIRDHYPVSFTALTKEREDV